MTKNEALKLALNTLESNKKKHDSCEDTWYSCPKHEDGCANDSEGDECNCGADNVNAQFDKAITAIKEALAQPEQEPVAMRYDFDGYGWLYIDNGSGSNWKEKIKNAEPLFTAPPQPKPLTDEEISDMWCEVSNTDFVTGDTHVFARAIEAAHGIKE